MAMQSFFLPLTKAVPCPVQQRVFVDNALMQMIHDYIFFIAAGNVPG